MTEQTHHIRRPSPGLLLLVLFICQTVEPLFGLQNVLEYNKRLSQLESAIDLPADKRTLTAAGGFPDQSKEVNGAKDRLDTNYDEYPMVVPKRAALLLDRLMVALHHALEKEHNGRERLSEFYNNKNHNKNTPTGGNERYKEYYKNSNNPDNKDSPSLAMYSDDDPSVVMDYDFKDLNSINRATGETLMARSFQRRANMGLDFDSEMGVEGVSSLIDTSSALSRDLLKGYNSGDSGVGVGVGGRRTASSYWRCYFNAVSCF